MITRFNGNLDFHRTRLEGVLCYEHEIQSLHYKNLGFHSTKIEGVLFDEHEIQSLSIL